MPLQSARKLVEPDVTVLELTGRITLAESRDLEELVHGVAAENVPKLVLDISGVDYVDSAGLGSLVRCYHDLKSAGGVLTLQSPNPRVRDILRLTHLDLLFPIES